MTGGMMFKGTPGEYGYRQSYMDENEWEVYPLHDGPPDNGDWAELCTCKDQYGVSGEGADEAKANAQLFAAAPELLEVCQMILKADYNCVTTTSQDAFRMPVISAAIAAIEKALGETK